MNKIQRQGERSIRIPTVFAVDHRASHSKTFALYSASILALFIAYVQVRHNKKEQVYILRDFISQKFSRSPCLWS